MGSGIEVIKIAVFAADHTHEQDTDVVRVCCPNETAEVQVYVWTNTIEWGGPTDVDHIVKWSGDLGDNPVINDHAGSYFEQYLYTRFRPGTHKVTASGSVGHKSVTVKVVVGTGTGQCNLTGISPATQQLFVGSKPFTFTAEGTGDLANVQWSAKNGTPPTGTGATFTTKWSDTGKYPVTATCGGTTKTTMVTVLDVSIETDDDVVQVKCEHPTRMFTVRGRIKVLGPATTPVNVILKSLDGRLTFPPDSVVKDVKLPANGHPVDFEIAGEKASRKIGDAKISVQAANGPQEDDDVAEKEMTVFSFDKAEIVVKRGGKYTLRTFGADGSYAPATYGTAAFRAKARLRPPGLDCTGPQISVLRIGIMQEISAFRSTMDWGRPTVAWEPTAKKDTTIKVESVRRIEVTLDPAVTKPVNMNNRDLDPTAPPDTVPLYDATDDAVKPPMGCDGAVVAASGYLGSVDSKPPDQKFFADDGTTLLAVVTWNKPVKATLKATFRTFCVVYDLVTQKPCALRQAKWTLNVDSSGPPGEQYAKVPPSDAAASGDPAMPPPNFGTANKLTRVVAVGTTKTTFKK